MVYDRIRNGSLIKTKGDKMETVIWITGLIIILGLVGYVIYKRVFKK
jgi:hypothetical protein